MTLHLIYKKTNKIKSLAKAFLLIISVVGISSCEGELLNKTGAEVYPTQKIEQGNQREVATEFSKRGFPEETKIVEEKAEEAEGFNFISIDGYKVLQIISHLSSKKALPVKQYLLLPRSVPVPIAMPGLAEMTIIRTPIESVVTSSTTHISLLSALGAEGVLVAHADSFVWNSVVNEKISQHEVALVGSESTLNLELVLGLKPDLYMAVASSLSNQNSHVVLDESGIDIIHNAEYLEKSLLGRAEWIKVMGALLGKEALAKQIFSEVKSNYLSLQATAKSFVGNNDKPLILVNSPFKGSWYVPGGEGYLAQLIADAGGDYLWKNESGSASKIVSLETMIDYGLQADIWINPGSTNAKLDEVVMLDSRLAQLKPYLNGEVYDFSKRVSANGANDYWESGVVFPDRILADLIKVFYPELLPEYEFYYYQKLE